MTTEPELESKERMAARGEIKSSAGMLLAALVVLVLAMRGVWSSMWYFPHIFGGIMAVGALVSVLKSRTVFWRLRLPLAIVIVVVCALLPPLHIRGVQAKTEAYERRAGEALIGTVGPSLPFIAALHNADGGSQGSLELGGRISLLNFWATWCGPCVEEIPLLQQFWDENRDLGIEVVGVTKLYRGDDSTTAAQEVTEFLAARSVTYPILIGDRASPAHTAYRVESLPTSVLVGRDGVVVDVGAGISGTLRLMEQAKKMMLR